MKSNKLQFITRTAVLLALALIFQMFRVFFPGLTAINLGFIDAGTLLIGILVNLTLFLSVDLVNVYSGCIIAAVTPIVAFLQGHLPKPFMIPVIIIGNLLLVIVFAIMNKKNPIIAMVASSVTKAAGLFLLVKYFVIPLFVAPGSPLVAKLGASFTSAAQIVTALLGGILAIVILPMIKKAIKGNNYN